MATPPQTNPPRAPGKSPRRLQVIAGLAAIVASVFFFHNYAINLFPRARLTFDPAKISPLPGSKSFAYIYPFDRSEPDYWMEPKGWFSPRSRAELTEDGKIVRNHLFSNEEVRLVGGDRWSHEPGQILFASVDNSDPRTNGRAYQLTYPILYTRKIGYLSAIVLGASISVLYWISRGRSASSPVAGVTSNWRWHFAGASLLLLGGLYCNTGSLAPYGNTHFGYLVKGTGYIYNTDHPHFRVLFDFVNGADRKVWDHALFLRRILFPVLAWPLMRWAGFETGGTIASLLLNLAGFIFFLSQLRKRVGPRGAVFAGWLLSVYPGAMYWGGLPYPYALIFPGSLVLMIALLELPAARAKALTMVSLGMGVVYLGYDLAAFFIPAAALVLLWQRRPGAALLSVVMQIIPSGMWGLFLTGVLGQSLNNSNTAVYGVIVNAYLHIKDYAAWAHFVSYFPTIGLDVWFGANFIFIPALFVVIVALNSVTSRIRFLPAEAALLAVGVLLFLFNNLAPDYYGLAWVLRGTWIARIYQPVFPALVVFSARWWQQLPDLDWSRRTILWTALLGTFVGNALIVFGPILGNPLRVSETAFYKFYDHSDLHWLYESHLKELGRRPLGFPRPQP